MRTNKYIWIRIEGKYKKLCRNPEFGDKLSVVDKMKYRFHNQVEDTKSNKKKERIRKWPQETRDSYVEAKDYEKRIIERLMKKEPEAKIYLRIMPEILVLGKTFRWIRTKKQEAGTKEIDEVIGELTKINVEEWEERDDTSLGKEEVGNGIREESV